MNAVAAKVLPVNDSPVIALLGQPNSGKSTLFNNLTGSRQHVGNWPGKTVEKKEGYYIKDGVKYTVADLPGTYSLSANSDEEIITREYIAGGEADLVCVLADASQLERSLFMLADYAGIRVPVILLLNMMDVAKGQGKSIDVERIGRKLGIPVIPFVAADRNAYGSFHELVDEALKNPRVLDESRLVEKYRQIEGETFQKVCGLLPTQGVGQYSVSWLAAKALEGDQPALELIGKEISHAQMGKLNRLLESAGHGSLLTGDSKFQWIGEVLQGAVRKPQRGLNALGRFDRIATSKRWGKATAVGIILLGLVLSFLPAAPFMLAGAMIPSVLGTPLAAFLTSVGAPAFLVSLICEGLVNALMFTVQMLGFVVGISLVFGLMEEIGYMARISYVFDSVMSKLGLQGKAAMPFLVSFGCTMGGSAGARVIDSWGQKVLTIALAWAVPCGATWVVVPTLAGIFFGGGAPLIMVAIILVMLGHMIVTAKIFGRKLVPAHERTGLIMELPPYHKPKWGNLFRSVGGRTKDLCVRALKVIMTVSVVFWVLSYSSDGDVSNSIIYQIGTFIEPATRVIGLSWQTFMAFVSSAVSKEAVLGVLSALYANSGNVLANTMGGAAETANLGEVLAVSVSKAEALAFMFATTFNIPCVVAVASTYQETRSLSWTMKIAGYYVLTALLICAVVYRIGLLLF